MGTFVCANPPTKPWFPRGVWYEQGMWILCVKEQWTTWIYSILFFPDGNPSKPSPSHNHFYRWYVYVCLPFPKWVLYYCFNHNIPLFCFTLHRWYMVISGGINHENRWVVIAVLTLRESVLVFWGVPQARLRAFLFWRRKRLATWHILGDVIKGQL